MAPTLAPAYAPGDRVTLTAPETHPRERLGVVLAVIDCGDEGTLYDVLIPARAPHPYFAAELRPATADDVAAHHPSWVRFLAEDWAWRQQRAATHHAHATPEGTTP